MITISHVHFVILLLRVYVYLVCNTIRKVLLVIIIPVLYVIILVNIAQSRALSMNAFIISDNVGDVLR